MKRGIVDKLKTITLEKAESQGQDEGAPLAQAQAQNKRATRLNKGLILAALLATVLLLSACGLTDDPPCTGRHATDPGCNNPVGTVLDITGTLPWYVDWAAAILKNIIVGLGTSAVQIGISTFWMLFKNLSSTDFANCVSGSPTCTATSIFQQMRTIALITVPMLLSWKIFKSYFLGGFIPSIFESFVSTIAKFMIAGFALSQMESIVSSAFSLSNSAFNAILGNPADLSALALKIVGNNGSGVLALTNVKNSGLLFFLLAVCILVAFAFIILGIVFILRTIMVFILFVMSPFAVVAALSDEFKPWFYKWLGSIQALLIAPIPAAVCFRLINAYVNSVPNPSTDPAGFFLRMIYVVSFLFIGGILMFKIAGAAGEMMFGVVAGAVGALTGFVAGSAVTSLASGGAGAKAGGATSGASSTSSSNSSNSNPKAASSSNSAISSGGAGAGVGSGNSNGAIAGGGYQPAAGSGYDNSQRQQQEQMTRAIRGLNENMTASRQEEAMQKLYSRSSRGGGNGYNVQADRNVQGLLRWAGAEAGMNTPMVSFAPAPGGNGNSGASRPGGNGPQGAEPPPLSETSLVGAEQGQGQTESPVVSEAGAEGYVISNPGENGTSKALPPATPALYLGSGGNGRTDGGNGSGANYGPSLPPALPGGSGSSGRSYSSSNAASNGNGYSYSGSPSPYGRDLSQNQNQSGGDGYGSSEGNQSYAVGSGAGTSNGDSEGPPVYNNVLTDPYGDEPDQAQTIGYVEEDSSQGSSVSQIAAQQQQRSRSWAEGATSNNTIAEQTQASVPGPVEERPYKFEPESRRFGNRDTDGLRRRIQSFKNDPQDYFDYEQTRWQGENEPQTTAPKPSAIGTGVASPVRPGRANEAATPNNNNSNGTSKAETPATPGAPAPVAPPALKL